VTCFDFMQICLHISIQKITRHYLSAHPHTTVNRGIHTVNASVSEGDTFILLGRLAVLGGKQIALTKK